MRVERERERDRQRQRETERDSQTERHIVKCVVIVYLPAHLIRTSLQIGMVCSAPSWFSRIFCKTMRNLPSGHMAFTLRINVVSTLRAHWVQRVQ